MVRALAGPGPKGADLDDQEYDTAVAVLGGGPGRAVHAGRLLRDAALQMRIFRVAGPGT